MQSARAKKENVEDDNEEGAQEMEVAQRSEYNKKKNKWKSSNSMLGGLDRDSTSTGIEDIKEVEDDEDEVETNDSRKNQIKFTP